MIWWQIALSITLPMIVAGLGLFLGKLDLLKCFKNITKPLFKSRRTYYAKKGYNTITFDKFLEFYIINPDKWDLDYNDDYIYYRTNNPYHEVKLYWETKYDIKQFMKWYNQQNRNNLVKQQKTEYRYVFEDIQKDVQVKMDAIQKEHEAETKRIEKEQEENRKRYEQLMKQMTNVARASAYSSNDIVNFYTKEKTKIYISYDALEKIRENNSLIKLLDGRFGFYFEHDCGIPYIRTVDGEILEVEFVK